MIPLLVPSMPTSERLLPLLRRIDHNAHYTNYGPLNAEFEAALLANAAAPGRDLHVTTLANCTVALELALQTLGLRPGARVLIPGITFVATATAVVRAGLAPVIADVDPLAWVLTPAIAMQALTEGPIDAVMPVSTFGYAHAPGDWDEFTARTGVPVIIDAAGAYGNQEAGHSTDVVFSFHATKSFGAAEGGAVLSTDTARIARIRNLSNFGLDTTIGQLAEWGTNGKMSEYHAAIGLATFMDWDRIRRERISLHHAYLEELAEGCPRVGLQAKDRDGIYPLLPVLLPAGSDAAHVAATMMSRGIQCRRWYSPSLHLHPALLHAQRMESLLHSTELGGRLLGIPFYLGISRAQRSTVIGTLHAILEAAA